MRWYNHQNRSVVVSVEGDCCTYHEVGGGHVHQTKTELCKYRKKWIKERTWLPITEVEARNILSSVLGEPCSIGSDLPLLFTVIDIHMFSSGEANEL